jgi:hypothetical protein
VVSKSWKLNANNYHLLVDNHSHLDKLRSSNIKNRKKHS